MGQAAVIDFAYEMAADSAGMKLALSVFSNRAQFRDELSEDAEIAGFTLRECGALVELLEGEPRPMGELVFLDCPDLDGAGYAALSRLDERAARTGARLIVATTVDALDAVYGCCSASDPQILVNPRRADRVIALGRMLAELSGRRVRELSEEDRRNLVRITEQVTHIAERIDLLTPDHAAKPSGGERFPVRTGSRFAPLQWRRAGACHTSAAARSAAGAPDYPAAAATRAVLRR